MSTPLANAVETDGERSIISPISLPPIIFQPWPWPSPTIPIATERSESNGQPLVSGDLLEVLEAVYPRPDVRSAVVANAKALAELIGEDQEAAKEFRDLVQEIAPGQGERELVTLGIALFFVGCAVAGGITGYLSRK